MTTDYLAIFCTSRILCKLITFFAMWPSRQFYFAQVVRAIGEDRNSSWEPLKRLVRTGFIVAVSEDGGRLYYQLNAECPVVPEIQRIVLAGRIAGDVDNVRVR